MRPEVVPQNWPTSLAIWKAEVRRSLPVLRPVLTASFHPWLLEAAPHGEAVAADAAHVGLLLAVADRVAFERFTLVKALAAVLADESLW